MPHNPQSPILDPRSVPTHIGFIVDGNRRWAREHKLPTFEGHRKGYENLKTIAEYAFKQGITYVSAFCFSTENWSRSKDEVAYLLKLARQVIRRDAYRLAKENIRIIIMGEQEDLPANLIEDGKKLVEETKHNTGGTLSICFNYGGQQEVAQAVQEIIKKQISVEEITAETISENIYFPEVPAIDLLIRTSGEQRISNFMLWRVAYAELMFIEKNWPDFSPKDLDKALIEYSKRNRRFGGN